ncbi:MAG TPA: amidase [Thermomicrobiales bacterium]|nr:amidase [Thermomicrobiales bacterium]
MSEIDLFGLTIDAVQAGYRTRRFSPVEVVRAALAQIAATEPTLRAFTLVDADGALRAAHEAEADLAHGRARGLLHGVPVGVKDIFDVEGQPTRCGSPSRDDAPAAAADAAAVRVWRDAGAIVVGKTVTQEFAAGVLSPPARNPWDPDRVPGGSSGGSAAAVGAGCVLAALGSDTGGSIRIPAAAVGVCGFKPAYGSIATDGVFPLSWSLDTIGPLARTVADVEIAWRALVGSDAPSSASPDALRGLRIGFPRLHFRDRLAPAVADAALAAADRLRDLGAEIVEADWTHAQAARDAAFIINRVETAAVHDATRRQDADRFGRMNPDLQLRVHAGGMISAADYVLAARARAWLRDSIAALFRDHRLDALLTPTLPDVAVRAADPVVRLDGGAESAGLAYTRLTMPFNATGQPVLALPAGFDAAGLPIGMQIAGRPGDEATLFRIGRAYEAAAGWSERRPPIPGAGV